MFEFSQTYFVKTVGTENFECGVLMRQECVSGTLVLYTQDYLLQIARQKFFRQRRTMILQSRDLRKRELFAYVAHLECTVSVLCLFVFFEYDRFMSYFMHIFNLFAIIK